LESVQDIMAIRCLHLAVAVDLHLHLTRWSCRRRGV
jgi:hypothetical protein